jgi:hypothetical protein
MSIKSAFLKFVDEAAIIGRLLAGYSDLELALAHCAQTVRNDFDTVLKTMFRTRGESQRIEVADAFGRQYYHALKLGTQFEMGIGAIKYCLKIRNQYAHCVWWDDYSGQLTFANLEEVAKSNALLKDFQSLTSFHVEVPLLQAQEAYFDYTDALLVWVNHEGGFRNGTKKQPLVMPAHLVQPAPYIP